MAGPVAQKAAHALVHEPLLSAPYAGLGFADLCPDRRGPATQQDHTLPPDVLLWPLWGRRDDAAQSFPVVGGYGKGDKLMIDSICLKTHRPHGGLNSNLYMIIEDKGLTFLSPG